MRVHAVAARRRTPEAGTAAKISHLVPINAGGECAKSRSVVISLVLPDTADISTHHHRCPTRSGSQRFRYVLRFCAAQTGWLSGQKSCKHVPIVIGGQMPAIRTDALHGVVQGIESCAAIGGRCPVIKQSVCGKGCGIVVREVAERDFVARCVTEGYGRPISKMDGAHILLHPTLIAN